MLDSIVADLRYAARALRRTPGFALTAILTLALGIGLSTAVFTVADALLLRRLPVHDQDRLVTLWGEKRDGTFPDYPLDSLNAFEFARRTQSLERVGFYLYQGALPQPIRDGDRISRLNRALVSGNFFNVLGAKPVLGRALNPSDDITGAAPVMVLSYAAWQQRFNGNPAVLGRRIVMDENGVAYTIVGVMPQGLEFPRGTEFWAPVIASMPAGKPSLIALNLIARLKPGATPANARDDLTAFFTRPEASRWQRDLRGVVNSLPRLILGNVRPALYVFASACALLLLITCVNVANLLLVRGLTRRREIAVRLALGGSRRRVIGALLIENVMLAIGGGALGLVVAAAAVRSFVAFAPAELPRLSEVHLNATALAAAIVITGIATLIFSLAPALMTSRTELQQTLRSDMRQSASRGSRFAAEALVAGQVALALLVLSAAGLIARSLVKLERAQLSLESSHLLIGELALHLDQFNDAQKQTAMLERLLPRLQAIPGVSAVSPVVAVPFAGSSGWDARMTAEGQSAQDANASPMLNMEVVTPSYFSTLGVPVLRGRGFTDADRDGAPVVVIVSQSTARDFWRNENPIGKRLFFGPKMDQTLTVVGVVPDTRYRDLRTARASIYIPLRQSFFPFAPLNLAIKTSGPPAQLATTLRRVIASAEPGVALVNAQPFNDFLAGPLAQPRLNALVLGVFAGSALLLAAVGLFGVMATMVRQRTREIGVRMALGATTRDVARMVVRRGFVIAAAGSVFGLFAAFATNRLLLTMLYEVSPTDSITLAAVSGVLLGVAALASLIPAWSSTRIDAMIALRAE